MKSTLAAGLLVLSVGCGDPASAMEANACLEGRWRLDNASIATAMQEALLTSTSGTDFTLEEIRGFYYSTIALDSKDVTVHWNNWQMVGTAVTQQGAFGVTLTLDGTQGYTIAKLSDGAALSERVMAVNLDYNNVTATVTFAGQTFPNQSVQIPQLADGTWDCGDTTLVIYNDGQEWVFTRDP